MSYLSERNAHLDRMATSILEAKLAFFAANRTRLHQQSVIEALIQSVCDEVTGLVAAASGDADRMSGHAERMIDDARLCFADAAERDPTPVGRQAPYGVAYDHARGA